MVSIVLSFFPRGVLDEILNLIESVSEDFPSYSYSLNYYPTYYIKSYTTFLTVNNDHRFHRSSPVNTEQLLTREALTMTRYSPENINID